MLSPMDSLALVADTRLPDPARILVLYLGAIGPDAEGWVEVGRDDLKRVLHGGASAETIRRHLRVAEDTGWIEIDANTGSRPTRYRVIPESEAGADAGIRASLRNALPHISVGQNALVHKYEGQSKTSGPQIRGPEGVSVHKYEGQSAPVVVEEVVEEVVEDARELFPISNEVERLFLDERLEGLRSALRDYLRRWVPPMSQTAFVGQVLGLFGELAEHRHWRTSAGGRVDPSHRAELIANALNQVATEERFDGKRHEAASLVAKVEYLARWKYEGPKAKKATGTDSALPTPPMEEF